MNSMASISGFKSLSRDLRNHDKQKRQPPGSSDMYPDSFPLETRETPESRMNLEHSIPLSTGNGQREEMEKEGSLGDSENFETYSACTALIEKP